MSIQKSDSLRVKFSELETFFAEGGDLRSFRRRSSEFLEVIIPCMIVKGAECSDQEKALFTQRVKKIGFPIFFALVGKVSNIVSKTLSSVPLESLDNEGSLPKNVEEIMQAEKAVKDYFGRFPIGEREDRESLLRYWEPIMCDELSLQFPLFSSPVLQQFLRPIVEKHITERMTEEHFAALKESTPNAFHNTLWISLIPYKESMPEFREFLMELDELETEKLKLFEKSVRDGEEESESIEKWVTFCSIGPYYEQILQSFLRHKIDAAI